MPRFTSHGEACYEPTSGGRIVHPFWGDYRQWWAGEAKPDMGNPQTCPTGCGGGSVVGAGQPGRATIPATVEDAYRAQLVASVDLHEHLPLLRELAGRCEWVVELSSWLNGALTGLSAGGPKHLVSICHAKKPEWYFYQNGQFLQGEGKSFEGIVAGPLDSPVPETDLLFVSTRHTADFLRAELALHAGRVRKWICLQNTSVFGERGDDGGPGLMVAVREFLAAHPEWHLREARTNNNGLAVLEREGTDPGADLPPPWDHRIPDPNTTPPTTASTLEETYERHAKWVTPINQHLATLRELASKCEDVVELGVATASSTVALLAAQPKKLVSVDIVKHPVVDTLRPLAGKTGWEFLQADSRQAGPWECDLLFIDSAHNADQLYAELTRHAPLCKRWIVLHDTVTYGERGEGDDQPPNLPPKVPGLLPAMRQYLSEHREWTVLRHHRHSHGLMVLTRDPKEKKPLPPMWKRGWNAMKASWRAGENVVGKLGLLAGTNVQAQRLELCTLCESRTGSDCAECGCPLDFKTSQPTEFCPLFYWDRYKGDAAGLQMEGDGDDQSPR